jgi:hypothetical protein
MDVTGEGIQDVCTDAVFKRGENYLAESRVLEIHRVDATVTAVVSGSRQYHVRVDLAVDGFDPWCDCPYDGPGACKHVVAVLLRCLDDVPPDEGDQLDAALDAADPDGLRAFLRDALATDAALRERFFARFGGPLTRSVDELRAAIDRRFEETNPSTTSSSSRSTSRSGSTSRTSTASRAGMRRRRPSTGRSSSRSTTTWSASTARTTTSRGRSRERSMGTSTARRPQTERPTEPRTPSPSSRNG